MMASKDSYFLEVMVEKENNVPMIPTGASVSDSHPPQLVESLRFKLFLKLNKIIAQL
jgi:hypothetical protein